MAQSIAKKAYYSIGEVCEIAGLKPHVLRYWETQFDLLSPNKNRAGNRVYRPKEVELVLLVQHLLHERKFTIEGARKALKEARRGGQLEAERKKVAAPKLVTAIKEDVSELGRILSLDIPLSEPDEESAG